VVSSRDTELLLSAVRSATLVLSLLCVAAWGQDAPPPDAAKSAAIERCRTHGSLDACDDAIRRNPRDPTLLIAMGDAQMRAKRPADAVRAYQRAASLAPDMPGIQQKLSAAQELIAKAKSSSGRNPATAATKRYTNSDPESQSH
jgi:cytochrome c-type biogenesis protein CcmH/NrfG